MKVSHNTLNLLYRFTDLLSLKVIALVKKIRLDTGITSTVLDIYSRHNQSLSSQLIIGTWNSVNVPVSKGNSSGSNSKEDSSSDGDAGAYDYDHREEKSDEDEGENDSGEEQWRNQEVVSGKTTKVSSGSNSKEDSSSDGDAGAYDYDHREEKSDEDEGENDS
ncbi:hypothetical protein Tco_0472388, partial [Tanacetum coccineum]